MATFACATAFAGIGWVKNTQPQHPIFAGFFSVSNLEPIVEGTVKSGMELTMREQEEEQGVLDVEKLLEPTIAVRTQQSLPTTSLEAEVSQSTIATKMNGIEGEAKLRDGDVAIQLESVEASSTGNMFVAAVISLIPFACLLEWLGLAVFGLQWYRRSRAGRECPLHSAAHMDQDAPLPCEQLEMMQAPQAMEFGVHDSSCSSLMCNVVEIGVRPSDETFLGDVDEEPCFEFDDADEKSGGSTCGSPLSRPAKIEISPALMALSGDVDGEPCLERIETQNKTAEVVLGTVHIVTSDAALMSEAAPEPKDDDKECSEPKETQNKTDEIPEHVENHIGRLTDATLTTQSADPKHDKEVFRQAALEVQAWMAAAASARGAGNLATEQLSSMSHEAADAHVSLADYLPQTTTTTAASAVAVAEDLTLVKKKLEEPKATEGLEAEGVVASVEALPINPSPSKISRGKSPRTVQLEATIADAVEAARRRTAMASPTKPVQCTDLEAKAAQALQAARLRSAEASPTKVSKPSPSKRPPSVEFKDTVARALEGAQARNAALSASFEAVGSGSLEVKGSPVKARAPSQEIKKNASRALEAAQARNGEASVVEASFLASAKIEAKANEAIEAARHRHVKASPTKGPLKFSPEAADAAWSQDFMTDVARVASPCRRRSGQVAAVPQMPSFGETAASKEDAGVRDGGSASAYDRHLATGASPPPRQEAGGLWHPGGWHAQAACHSRESQWWPAAAEVGAGQWQTNKTWDRELEARKASAFEAWGTPSRCVPSKSPPVGSPARSPVSSGGSSAWGSPHPLK